jgi:hypothetical protein
MDIRKYGIVIAVAILTAIFIYAVADALAPQAEWKDCGGYYKGAYPEPRPAGFNCTPVPTDRAAEQACVDQKNTYQPTYDEYGCVESYECSTCQRDNEALQQRHRMVVFYTAIILGLVSIIGGFMLPLGSIHEWVGLGFIVGGVMSLFIGTAQYWGDLARLVRPIVIGIELVVLLFIVYKRMRVEPVKVRSVKKRK